MIKAIDPADLTRKQLHHALELGPQSVRPPRLAKQDKAELVRSVRLGLRADGRVRDHMLSALEEASKPS